MRRSEHQLNLNIRSIHQFMLSSYHLRRETWLSGAFHYPEAVSRSLCTYFPSRQKFLSISSCSIKYTIMLYTKLLRKMQGNVARRMAHWGKKTNGDFNLSLKAISRCFRVHSCCTENHGQVNPNFCPRCGSFNSLDCCNLAKCDGSGVTEIEKKKKKRKE